MSINSQPSNAKKQIFISLCVFGAMALCGFGIVKAHGSEEQKPDAPQDPNLVSVTDQGKSVGEIKTEPAKTEQWEDKIVTSGMLSFPTDATVKIAPRLTGKVRSVLVKVGDRVTPGQPLAILDSIDAAAAETTAQLADATLKQAELDLQRYGRLHSLGTPDVTAAQAALDQAKEGELMAKRVLDLAQYQDKIGGFTEKPLEDARNAQVAAVSSLSQARADFLLAQKDLERKKKLLAIGVAATADLEVSQDTYDKAAANVKQNEDSLKLAQQAVDREEKAFHSRLYADQQLEQASSSYRQAVLQRNAAETALRMAKAQIQRDLDAATTAYRTAVYNAQNAHRALVLLNNPSADGSITITSPAAGVVTERDVAPGQNVDQSTLTPWQLMVISNDNDVWVDADVYEKDISRVSPGQPVTIKVAALPGKTFDGRVLRIAPTLDKSSRAVKVRADIPNVGHFLRDGEYADVKIASGRPRQALTIPWAGVFHDGDDDYSFVLTAGKYAKRRVTVGQRDGDRCEILSGLHEGDQVVTHGALLLGGQTNGD